MGRRGFAVTYDIVTEESACDGDAEERGFIVEDCGLREAIKEASAISWDYIEADEWPIRAPRWFTYYPGSDGSAESRSLHIPDHVTNASRRRIAKLIGAHGA